MPDFSFINPTLTPILRCFKLDLVYQKGQGHYLYDEQGRAYLDFIAQYGAVPFGYNPTFLIRALQEALDKQVPSLVQPSTPFWASTLAEELTKMAPGDMKTVTFCQSGAEAVEAAIKMARAATRKEIIVSTHNSFHGKTLGALSATGKPVYQKPFFAPAPGFVYVDYDDLRALEEVFRSYRGEIAAFIVEPVQGEGGIIVPSPGYLKACQELCREHKALFIADEIQTGLGRTGSMFACQQEEVEPDIITLAKALGGGLVPLGAVLANEKAWSPEFGRYHSSTFANNNLTCCVGLAVLEYLREGGEVLLAEVRGKGDYLLARCRDLMVKYPGIIREVRGKGLMLGFEFAPDLGQDSYDLFYLVNNEGFLALIAGHLLHVHGIRVAPYLNNSMTLRLEPPLTVTYEEIDRVVAALDRISSYLYFHDYAGIYGYLVGRTEPKPAVDYRHRSRKVINSRLNPGEKPEKKFAFVIHYPGVQDLVVNNPSFEQFSQEELEGILDWQKELPGAGVVAHLEAIRSQNGEVAEGWLIAVPFGARQMKSLPRKILVESIQEAVDMARDLGAGIVGLGAFTSIVTRGGRDCQGRGVAVTSGNSFTILMAMEGLFKGAELMDLPLSKAVGGVVGATGSIGRVCALLLSEKVSRLVLFGNPEHPVSSQARLRNLAVEIIRHAKARWQNEEAEGVLLWLKNLKNRLYSLKQSEAWEALDLSLKENMDSKSVYDLLLKASSLAGMELPVAFSLDLDEVLPQCDLIVAASNSPDPLIRSHHLKPGAVVCDVARPGDVAHEVLVQRDDVLILEGGLVELPDSVSFGPNMGYPPGVALACLSETILLALAGHYQDCSIGSRIPLEDVEMLRGLALKHGFKLAALRLKDRELSFEEVEAIRERACRKKEKKAQIAGW